MSTISSVSSSSQSYQPVSVKPQSSGGKEKVGNDHDADDVGKVAAASVGSAKAVPSTGTTSINRLA